MSTALGLLTTLHAAGERVALVLTDQWLPDGTGSQLLGQVRDLFPHSRRLLLIDWGDWAVDATAQPLRRGIGMGLIDYYVLKPWRSGDELDGVVELAVALGVEPVGGRTATAARVDRRRAVVAGEVVTGAGAGHVTHLAQHAGSGDRADTEEVGEPGGRLGHGGFDLSHQLGQAAVDGHQVPTPTPDRLPLIDLHAVATRLGVNVRFVRHLVAEDRITFFKVGRLLRIDPAEVEAWLDRSRRGFRRPA